MPVPFALEIIQKCLKKDHTKLGKIVLNMPKPHLPSATHHIELIRRKMFCIVLVLEYSKDAVQYSLNQYQFISSIN